MTGHAAHHHAHAASFGDSGPVPRPVPLAHLGDLCALARLLVAPLPLSLLIGGDVLSAFLFGLVLSAVPVAISFGLLGAGIVKPLVIAVAIGLSALCFAAMGTLFSTPPTDEPSSIMMLSNLVRLPLIFFSGVFVPVSQMPQWGQWLSRISPLTYTTELLRTGIGQQVQIGLGGAPRRWRDSASSSGRRA